MSNIRSDVHSPKNLVPEDYEFVGCGSFGSGPDYPGYSPLVHEPGKTLVAEGWTFGENESAGDCWHCGARLTYFAIMQHLPSHSLVRIGETCLSNRFERSSEEFHALRKQAQLDRERQAIKAHRVQWFAEDATRQPIYDWCTERVNDGDYGYEGMRHSFVHKINRYGDTSDKFVAAMIRDRERTEGRDAKRAAEALEHPAAPVVEGKVQVAGVILTVKWQDSQYGGSLKMLVRTDYGAKLWGTCPRSVDDALSAALAESDAADLRALLGAGEHRVSFVATVTASPDDETFGFYSRPTKAVLITPEV